MASNWYEALGDAVSDIRQKYEEAVWGRSLGENDAPAWPQAEPGLSFGSSTKSIETEPQLEQAQDIDLDR
jgi:hypothetical protein